MSTPANLNLFVGNRRYVAFRLRNKGSSGYVNVSAAQEIRLEYRRSTDSSLLAPILADRSAPGADWAAGRVLFLVDSTGITARVGTYYYAVTVVLGGITNTYHASTCEVQDRPLPLPSLSPDLSVPVSYTASDLFSGANVSDTAIVAGMPISRVGAGIAPASWSYPAADGVAISDAPVGYTAMYVGAGSRVRRADWTSVVGSVSLPGGPSSPLYLGLRGTFTNVEPALPAATIKQVVGEVGADGQTVVITLDYLVTL